MILVIDNYDSFTWNLVHLFGALGEKIEVVRNDALTAEAALALPAKAIIISPGPGEPAAAGICIELIRRAAAKGTPVFGVCLGLQAIVEAFGGRIIRAPRQMHGKTSRIDHTGDGLFDGLPQGFEVARYHSLIGERNSLPARLRITATSVDDGEIMAIADKAAPIAGVQFHPESIASEHGAAIARNFLARYCAPEKQRAQG